MSVLDYIDSDIFTVSYDNKIPLIKSQSIEKERLMTLLRLSAKRNLRKLVEEIKNVASFLREEMDSSFIE